jgi:hypothetical protein
MSDLWFEASADHDLEAREASLAQAEAEMMPVWPFLFEARSERELDHRLAFAQLRIEHIAAHCGLDYGELAETARRRYALLKQALPEGADPVDQVLQSGRTFGTGPEKPDEHRDAVDFAHNYSEIPPGPLGGPNPAVTRIEEPEIPGLFGGGGEGEEGPGIEPTASLCRCGSRITRKGKCRVCRHRAADCMCRTAQGPAQVMGPALSGPAAAGVGTTKVNADGTRAGGTLPPRVQAPAAPAVSGAGAGGQYDLTPAQDVTAARRRPDPVRRQVEAIAASVQASNPYLSGSECRRVARRVVGTYLSRQADMAGSVLSDEPWRDAGPQPSGGGGGDGGDGGMLQHGLEWRGLKSMMPGGGAGAAGELGEAAELAAL